MGIDGVGNSGNRFNGLSVRPVRENNTLVTVAVTANPAEGGTVSGSGAYAEGTGCTLTATPAEGYTFQNWTENGEVVSTENPYTFTVTGDRELVANFAVSGDDSHEYVDLGLPSGTLWATCNVGANSPEDYGDYFAWGETQPKDYYDWSTYQYCMGSENTLTKYCSNSNYGYNGSTDNLTVLQPEDDAATANWGNDWRMPTQAEWQELYQNTTVIWTTRNGVNGRLYTASNGNSLFLPAAGYRYNSTLEPDYGYYWSSSLDTDTPRGALYLYFLYYDYPVDGGYPRYCGLTIRPVRTVSQNTSFIIDATANPAEGGEVNGGGTYEEGAECTLTAMANEGYTFTNWTENGEVVSTIATYTFSVSADRTLVANFTQNGGDDHEYVDLGLPSGLLWATCNVGATAPEEYGDYFAWGETQTKEDYSYSTYQYCNGSYNTLTKYCNDGSYGNNGYTDTLTLLLPTDDAATAQWGAGWRMPTYEEWQELLDNTTNTWTTQNGVNGRLFTAANGASLFLPAAGCRLNSEIFAGSYGYYWSGSLYTGRPDHAWGFSFSSDGTYMSYPGRNTGQSVRPVRSASQDITTYWTPNNIDYEENMPITAVVEIDGVEQQSTTLELGAFSGEECRGSQMAVYFEPTQRYIYQMTVFGEEGDEITFRLYDHATNEELDLVAPEAIVFDAFGYGNLPNPIVLNFRHSYDINTTANPAEGGTVNGGGTYLHGDVCTLTATPNTNYVFVNWTLDGEVVSTEAEYSFEVTSGGDYVARFDLVQTTNFSQGWNWWSTYIEQEGTEGLEALENGLGANGSIVKAQNEGYVSYLEGYGWYGSLERLYNEQSYRVQANAACVVPLQGLPTNPADHPITLNPGWTWMGFPWSQTMSVEAALEGFEPEANDFIKGRNAYTMYYAENGYSMWFGPLNSLEPGQGYVYYSNSGEAKTLTLNTNDGRSAQPNVTASDNLFHPEAGNYADNMTLTAVVDFGGTELRSEDYEVAAFCNGECRGSAKLTYFAPTDSYIAFLTLYGNDGDELEFVLTDGDMTTLSGSTLHFATDGEPYPLCFGFTGLDDNASTRVSVYPNPSRDVFNVKGEGIRRIDVFNAFGQVVFSAETSNDTFQVDLSDKATGVYLLRVVTESGVTNQQLIKE